MKSTTTSTRTARTLGYWTTTSLVSFVLLSGGVASLLRRPDNVEGMAELGYPAYMLTILGFWKVLGAAALLSPRLPRLKEWAYAGTLFDLTGAAFSHAVSGPDALHAIWPALFATLALASWALRPEDRVLGSLRTAAAAA